MLHEGMEIVAYYADAENPDDILGQLHSELELVIPNTADYNLEVASLASVVVNLGIIREAPRTKLGDLLEALTRVASAPKFSLKVTRDPKFDCDKEVFEAKRQGAFTTAFSGLIRCLCSYSLLLGNFNVSVIFGLTWPCYLFLAQCPFISRLH